MDRPSSHSAAQAVEPWRTSFGLALILCGQPIAWSIRGQLVPGSENPAFPAVAILLGLALMFDPKWIVQRPLYCAPTALAIPLFGLLLPLAALGVLAPGPIQFATIAYSAVLIALTLMLAMTPQVVLASLPKMVLLVGLVSCIVPLVELAIGGPAKGFFRLTVSGNDNPLVIGGIGGMTALAGMVVGLGRGGRGVLWGIFAGLGTAVGVLTMLLTNTRSAALMLALCVPLFLLVLNPRTRRESGRGSRAKSIAYLGVLATGAAAAPAVAIALLGPDLFFDLVMVGLLRFAGAAAIVSSEAGAVDLSTSIRVSMLRELWDNLSLAGEGYMAQAIAAGAPDLYPHLSYAQAFYDLGLAGGVAFAMVTLVLPLALAIAAVLRGGLAHTEVLTILLLVFIQGEHLAHTTPYWWSPLVPAMMVFTLVRRGTPSKAEAGAATGLTVGGATAKHAAMSAAAVCA